MLVEGSPSPPFENHRGIRQGDPLSPILFGMVMDALSKLIEIELRNKKLDTYQVNGATSITHLTYADDFLIVFKANPKSLNSIKALLHFHQFLWT